MSDYPQEVGELLELYDWENRREGFKPARFQAALDKPCPKRFEGKLAFRSEVPDHLLLAYDVALGAGLVEQYLLVQPRSEQLEFYRILGWPVGMPEVPQDQPWTIYPDWSDALVTLTVKGYSVLASYRMGGGPGSGPGDLPKNEAKVKPEDVPAQLREHGKPEGEILTVPYLAKNSVEWGLKKSYISQAYTKGKLTYRLKVGPAFAYLYTELLALRQTLTDNIDRPL